MALIGKIREKSWLLVIVVGVAMLAFVLGDMNPFNSGIQEDVYGIGTIDGKKIDEDQYNTYVNNARNNILQNKLQQNPTEMPRLTKADQDNAANQAWQTSIMNYLMDQEYKKAGIIVDDYELNNILYGENGYEPSDFFANQFIDSITGEFAPDQLRQALEQLQESNDAEQIQQYNAIMDYIRSQRQEEKYNILVSRGIHTTTLEGKTEYNNQKTVKSVSYVYKRLTEVPAEEVGVPTEEDIKKYFEKHKNDERYKQTASRKISYFDVQILPNEDDTLNAKEFLSKLVSKFEESQKDSSFVIRYSDVKFYSSGKDGMAKPEGTMTQGPTYPLELEEQIKEAEIGTVFGPYVTQDGIKISKLIGFEAEKTATVRHILLNAQSPDEVTAAQKKADSIVRVIRSKNNFEDMVTEFSDDPGSKNTGGKYENFTEGMMVPEFNDFSFEKPIGTLGTVKTSYGIHIIEVLGRDETKYPVLANVVKNVEATKSTADGINSMASNFIYELDDLFYGKSIEEQTSIFDSFAVSNGYYVRSVVLTDENPSASEFSEVAEGRLFRLAYDENAKAGDLSSSPIRDQDRFVVALLTEITKDGAPELSTVKDMITEEVKKEFSAQYLVDRMLGYESLESLSSELGVRIETEGITFSASNVAIGAEPKLVGTAFSGLLDGETSVPVIGNNGVFVLRVDQTTLGEETSDYSAEIEQLKSQNITSFSSQYRNALKNAADVKDNRKLRSFGIR